MKIEASIGTEMEFAGLPQLWLESGYNNGWTFSGGTRQGQELSLKKMWAELLPTTPLPIDFDLTLRNIELELELGDANENGQRNYSLKIAGGIKFELNVGADFESHLNFEHILLHYKKTATDEKLTTVDFSLKGDARINDEIIVTDFSLDFAYKHNHAGNKAEWHIDGELNLLAFQRMMHFKARAEVLAQSQSLSFEFNSSEPILHKAYFNRIQKASAAKIMQSLNGGHSPGEHILISKLSADAIEKLGGEFSPEQVSAISKIIENAKRGNAPLVTIPDLLNENKPLCELSPRKFLLHLVRENGRFKSMDFAIGSDLVLYNNYNNGTELFNMKNGVVSTGFDNTKKEFYFKFNVEHLKIVPLNAIAAIPGIMDMLAKAFGESAENSPKASALANMLEIHPLGFTFYKKENNWNLNGGVKLILNDNLKTVDQNLFEFIEHLFPKAGHHRFISGQLAYDSKEGLFFVLENNNGIQVPDFMHAAVKSLDPQFKAGFKERTAIDLDQTLQFGTSYILLDRLRLKIAKEIKLDLRLAIGLPSKLNDRLFNPSSKIHGLITTFDHDKFKNAKHIQETGTVLYDAPTPDDSLIRVLLSFGTDGISGKFEKFNVFNTNKLAEEFKGFIKPVNNGTELDFKALTFGSDKEFLKLHLDNPEFKLDFKTCAFTISGGIKLLSDTITLPVKPLLKKLIGILPPDKFNISFLNKLADKFVDSIAFKSISFYNKDEGKLKLDELLNFLNQFLLKEQQENEIIPKDLVDLINRHLSEISKVLPELLLDYLSLKIPAGVNFKLQVTADQSVSFALEVAEPSPEQKQQGYTDYLQMLIPNPPTQLSGLRLKKIGLGSGLFNQALRLDLSAELMSVNLPELIPSIGLALLRNSAANDARLQHMVPDAKKAGNVIKIENLLMFIFPQTQIPIPVPVFYDDFYVYTNSLIAGASELRLKFPTPKVNIVEVIKGVGDLVNFFKNRDFVLPVSSYGLARGAEEVKPDSIVPSFHAGPLYYQLPGIIGYEKQPDGSRKHIRLGFNSVLSLNPKDLFSVAANTTKFGIMSVAEKKPQRIKVNDVQSEYPLNYLVKFLPASQRIGSQRMVLFEFMDAHIAWALSTPSEFKESVLPLLKKEQLNGGVSGPGDTWTANEITSLIPGSDLWSNEHDGIVILLKGGVKIGDYLTIDAVTATALSSGTGFATGLSLRTKLLGVLDMELSGGLQLNTNSAETKFSLSGKALLKLLGGVELFKGNFLLSAGHKPQFQFNGKLDLFPNELFGDRSPIQLYSGTSLGQKSDISGIIDSKGVYLGHFNSDGSISPAGIFLEIGKFYLAGTTKIISTADIQDWEIKLIYCKTELVLIAGFIPTETGTIMQFGLSLNQPVGIEGFVQLSGTGGNGGANGKLKILLPHGNKFPVLQEFYLGGRLTFLGLYTDLMIHLSEDEWQFALSNGVSIPGLMDANFSLNCRMASNYGWLKANSDFNVKLSLTIPKISFWVWFFGWHEVVIFGGTTWNNGFNTKLSISVYNPNTFDQVMNYDQELAIVNAEIEKLVTEQEQKVKELETKINGYNKKKQELKSQLEIKLEIEKEIETLRQGLMSLRILDDLMTARDKKGNDDGWKDAYDSAWKTYFTLANEYTSRLDKIGYSTPDEKKVFLSRLEYLDKIFDYIVANGNKKYGYTKDSLKKVIDEGSAPDYDVILQFVLEAANYKKSYLAKHNISWLEGMETDSEILNLQAKISDLYLIDQLFWARNAGGSDPQSENVLKYTSEKLFGAIQNYRQRLETDGWKNEEQKQLYKVRVSYLNKIKENVIARGYRSNGYNQEYVDNAVIRGIMPGYDIILPVLFEVEKIKNNMFEKAGIEKLYEVNNLPTQKLPEGFGLNSEAYEKNLAYNRLLTKDGLYDYLKDEILTNEISLRKLRERAANIQNQKNSYSNRQPGEFRFELFMESQLVINKRVIYLPKVSLLVAPSGLQEVIGNIGTTVANAITGNVWNLILDAFKGNARDNEDMSDAMPTPGNDSSNENEFEFIFHKQPETEMHADFADTGDAVEIDPKSQKPPGYDENYDISKYV